MADKSVNNWWNKVHSFFVSTADASLGASAAETSLIGTGVGNLTLPDSFFQVGRMIRINLRGRLTTTTPTPTITYKFKLGSTVIASATGAMNASLTNKFWEAYIDIACRSTGSSGSVIGQGMFRYNISAATQQAWEMVNTAAVTVSTTQANAVDFTAQYSITYGGSIVGTNAQLEFMHGPSPST